MYERNVLDAVNRNYIDTHIVTRILSIFAQPAAHKYTDHELQHFMEHFVTDAIDQRKLAYISRESGIKTKYSALPDFKLGAQTRLFSDPAASPSTAQRMKVFIDEAPALGETVARSAMHKAGIRAEELDAIIAVSCTGQYAPGLEIDLAARLGLKDTIDRHAINFMGCYAAFHGLRLADLICAKNPKARVLLVSVELCSLHFRNDRSDDNLLSTALFSDGAAAVVLGGPALGTSGPASIESLHSSLIPEGKKAMGWYVGNEGFEMILDRSVPGFVEESMEKAFFQALDKAGWQSKDIGAYAIHPGGKNILRSFANALNTKEEDLRHSFSVLEHFGNMSSCSVLFVLDQLLSEPSDGGGIYAAAFGPGLTIESALIKRSD